MNIQNNSAKALQQKKPFKKAWGMLPANNQSEVRESIMQLCGWKSKVTFYAAMNGKSILAPCQQMVISEIFAGFNIDAFAASYINPEKENAMHSPICEKR